MYRIPVILLTAAFFCFLWISCEQEREKYYDRPSWLEPPVYHVLEEKGNFHSYLHCVDKAGYKQILSAAGYYTVFAPTDEAFQSFLNEKGLNSVEEIDTLTAKEIVSYSIIQNAYIRERLDDYQSTDEVMWLENKAFKRQTKYFKGVYDETLDDKTIKVVDQNGVLYEEGSGYVFSYDDNNYKHIPYFTTEFMSFKNITSYDYNYFFPDKEYTGFNVVDARVIEYDLLAENGVVHVIDRVILPLPNIEELIAGNSQYSLFKDIIDDYLLEYDLAPASFQERYREYSGITEDVYMKVYPLLNYAPNCENFLKYGGGEDYDAQIDGWSIFVPTNDAIQQFFDKKFLTYYKSLDNMSPDLIADFINAHMFRTIVWPSKFESTYNPFGEEARFDPESDVIEKRFASNGVFYGVNNIQKSDAFYTVMGEISLNPDYSLMLQAIKNLELHFIIMNNKFNFTVFLISNNQFESIGLTYDADRNSWNIENTELGTNPAVAIARLINLHVVFGKNITDLTTNNIVETYGGEYIRISNGRVWAAGNRFRDNVYQFATDGKEATNGYTYELKPEPLVFSTKNIGDDIEKTFGSSKFYKYLIKSAQYNNGFVYDTVNSTIASVSNTENTTLLIPDDAAIDSAVNAGYLPEFPEIGTFSSDDELEKVFNFVMYHILPKSIVVPDGVIAGEHETLYKTVDGKTYVLIVNNPNGDFALIDNYNRITYLSSDKYKFNVLSNRAVLHQIDNYLKY
ncbi:MAG: fasciclin domain-containing protein [Bacteroidales bacterium]|nr:fasciclin domain-containing protein [Bacteroidales bacterium]